MPQRPEIEFAPPGEKRRQAAGNKTRMAIIVSCEHGGNRIPPTYRNLFSEHLCLLNTHRGYDFGALMMARELAKAFNAPLIASKVSRLLVDLNRSEHHPQLHLHDVWQASSARRQRILAEHYYPYRQQVERVIRQRIARAGQVLHLSVHSFTPALDGEIRQADIGLLYDPSRPGEASFCRQWQGVLATVCPSLRVRRNYPYQGRDDGLTSHLRGLLSAETYLGVELEINQSHAAQPEASWRSIRTAVADSLHDVLALQCRPPMPASLSVSHPTKLPNRSRK